MPVPAGGDTTDPADALVTHDDLETFLQQGPLDAAATSVARRVAAGWLQAATKLATWPDPLPDDLWSWALELAGLAYVNPEGLATDTTGGTTSTWERGRRSAILAEARQAYGAAATGRAPLFSFPDPDWSWRAVPAPPA